MLNNPFLYNSNLQPHSYFSVFPVGKIEEVSAIFPDLQGRPLFFFDQSRNEFFVKQRNVKTGEVQILRYILSSEPFRTTPDEKNYGEEIQEIKKEIKELASIVGAKAKKGASPNDESE